MRNNDDRVAHAAIVMAACVAVGVAVLLLRSCISSAAAEPSPVVEDVMRQVAEETDTPYWVIRHRCKRESDHKPWLVRYCVKWQPSPLKRHMWKCAEENDCRKNCTRKKIWINRLDVGLFQLRDAPSWSWRRWFNKEFDEDRPPECLIDPDCAADIAIEAILYLKKRAAREKWKCKTPKIDEIAWLAWWNGCGCYMKTWKLWRKAATKD